MNAAMNQDNERQLALCPIGAGKESVGTEDDRIAGALANLGYTISEQNP